MVDETRLIAAVDELNDLLPGVTPYKLAVVNPAQVEHVAKNAHYMSKKVFDQLVANVAQDGNLASLPFCWKRADGRFICLSGNHRIDAAAAAGIITVLVLYTDAKLSKAEQISIQLSHNAITGKDNETILAELWREIDHVKLKVYSGLDERYFDTLGQVKVQRISEEPLRFEELRLQFVSSEMERVEETVKAMGSAATPKILARVEDFDRFFELLLQFKETQNVLNSATALLMMMDVVEAWLHEHKEGERGQSKE